MMGKSARLLLVATGLVALSYWAQAQQGTPDTQFGNFLFSVPNAWNPQEKGEVMYIFAPSPPPGTTGFIALSADNMEGDLQNSFRVLWSGFSNSYRVLRGGNAQPLRSAKGYDALYTEAIASDKQGRQWHVFVVGAQYKGRLQTVMFMDNFDESYHRACFNIFQRWLANLTFGDALPGQNLPRGGTDSTGRPAPLAEDEDKPHKLSAGSLEGFYVGLKVSGYGSGAGREPLYFSPDGWVVKIDLNNSMIGFDLTAYRNSRDTNRSWVGRYRVDGNDINIVWQDYTDHREIVKRNEAASSPGLNTFVPSCRCTGKRFAGRYNYGLAASGKYLQFFADGTFIDHSVTDQMFSSSAFYNNPRTQRGTYVIEKQSMIFSFSDGHRGMRTFLAPKAQENGQRFDWINLGIDTLFEAHYESQP
jgi:hypothetical protein